MLTARTQWDFVCDLVARFEYPNRDMGHQVDYQSQYIAIVAMLRSIGHTFYKVDAKPDPARRAWADAAWKLWEQETIFSSFIEPTRNRLMKEFRHGLQVQTEAFTMVGAVADPSFPGGAARVATFDPHQARDLDNRPVLPLFKEALSFWDRCLKEAEAHPAFRQA